MRVSPRSLSLPTLLPQVAAGLLMGIAIAVDAVSLSLAMFIGVPDDALPFGISVLLLSAAIAGIVVSLGSSYKIASISPSYELAALFAPIAGAIVSQLTAIHQEAAILPTIWAAIGLTSLFTGLLLFAIGYFRLSRWFCFIPYPVLGGFLAGTGWLLLETGLAIATGETEVLKQVQQLWQWQTQIHLLPALLLTGLLIVANHRFDHFLTTPLLLLLSILLANLAFWLTNTSLSEAIDSGWFLAAIQQSQSGQFFYPTALTQVNWSVLVHQSSNLISILTIAPLVLIFETTGLKILLKREIDIDQELKANGAANLLLGLGGGSLCYQSIANTILNLKIGATSRLAGLIAALLTGLVLFWGGDLLTHIPTFILIALTILVGFDLLYEWLYESWFKLSHLEYALVLVILGIVILFGFLPAIGLGILTACILFVVNYSHLEVIKYSTSGVNLHSGLQRSVRVQKLLEAEGSQIYVLHLQGYIFFGTANTLLQQIHQRLLQPDLAPIRFLILNFRQVSGLDASATLSLTQLQQLAQEKAFHLVLTHLHPTIDQQLRRGVLQAEAQCCRVFADLDRGIEWCEDQILEAIPQRRRRALPLALQLNDLFNQTEHVSGFMDYLEALDLEAGEVVFQQGELAEFLYFVEVGQVTLIQNLAANQTRRLQSLGPGTLVGEMNFFLHSPHQTSAIVDQPSTLYRLSQAAMRQMRQAHPEVAATFQDFVIGVLSNRLTVAYQQVGELLQ